MLFGRMNHPCRWRHTDVFVVGRMVAINPALNTQLRYMCGLASAGMERPRPAFLRVSWMQSCIVKYWMSIYLVPFIQTVYPHNHRFMQDNDPKHTSRRAQAFFTDKGINWWRTPPESPDANPIENLWHELKVCVRVCKCKGVCTCSFICPPCTCAHEFACKSINFIGT